MEHQAPESASDLEQEKNTSEPQADGSGESADDADSALVETVNQEAEVQAEHKES
jgi:hypothetical protein